LNRPTERSTERVACPDCGLVQLLLHPLHRQVAECSRCGRVLAGSTTGRIDTPLALSLAALLLFVPALAAPLLGVYTYGTNRQAWLSSPVTAVWSDGFPSLSIVAGAFTIVLPLVFLLLLIGVLGGLHFGVHGALGPAFRWARSLRPWVMIEVFLVGCFVAYSRIKVFASVDVDLGGWCLIAATFMLMLALTQLDDRTVWEALRPRTHAAPGAEIIACTVCDFIDARTAAHRSCARCGARLHWRRPASRQRTLALVVAGALLYIPANTLPVLTTVRLGHEETNTILSGVFELVRYDLWPLAVIVFAASIVLPMLKLIGLSWMLLAIALRSSRYLRTRTRLYRMIDVVGRWSNIDVFMVSVLVALLQLGALTSVHAGNGLVAFAAVVIITMIATLTFDARLMWDAAEEA
jgi:paraquat-inducible protein A